MNNSCKCRARSEALDEAVAHLKRWAQDSDRTQNEREQADIVIEQLEKQAESWWTKYDYYWKREHFIMTYCKDNPEGISTDNEDFIKTYCDHFREGPGGATKHAMNLAAHLVDTKAIHAGGTLVKTRHKKTHYIWRARP